MKFQIQTSPVQVGIAGHLQRIRWEVLENGKKIASGLQRTQEAAEKAAALDLEKRGFYTTYQTWEKTLLAKYGERSLYIFHAGRMQYAQINKTMYGRAQQNVGEWDLLDQVGTVYARPV